jgi:hypothetical protein
MGHQQLIAHEVNIGFDTAKAMRERIEQRPGMFIVVVRVGREERDDGCRLVSPRATQD